MATITFYGAIDGVTGSAYLLTTEYSRILLDHGVDVICRERKGFQIFLLDFPAALKQAAVQQDAAVFGSE